MEHHPKYEHSRFIGDKRTQLVYDLDSWDDEAVINDIVDQRRGSQFRARHARRGPKPWLHPGDARSPSTSSQAAGVIWRL
jgi:hypothetical protein